MRSLNRRATMNSNVLNLSDPEMFSLIDLTETSQQKQNLSNYRKPSAVFKTSSHTVRMKTNKCVSKMSKKPKSCGQKPDMTPRFLDFLKVSFSDFVFELWPVCCCRDYDAYGFEKPDVDSQELQDFDEFFSKYLRVLTKREKRWQKLYSKDDQLKRSDKGVSLQCQSSLWQYWYQHVL